MSDDEVFRAIESEVDGKEDDDGDGLVENEGVAPRVIREPGQPTEKHRREHEMTHVPYSCWCPHCVRGRAKGRMRRRVANQEGLDIPRAAIDYCFFTRKGAKTDKDVGDKEKDDPNKSQTVLVMKEATTHMVGAYPVDKKRRRR